MKVAILTHPLEANYGGILQAYALSTILRQQGHDVIILRRNSNSVFVKRMIKQILISTNHPRYNSPRFKAQRLFKAKYINESKILYSSQELSQYICKRGIDIVIVGSDQVWRADFAKKFGYDYFLEFVPNSIRKVAYAASFGLSTWDYTPEQTSHIRKLLKDFYAVSIREAGGVKFCSDYLNCKAEHVLDPTMLLSQEHYSTLANPQIVRDNYNFVYWLGDEIVKEKILEPYQDKKNVEISLRQGEVLPSIEDWLSYIKYADRVITDSFHGLVFSLLFHKKIVLFLNDKGGNDRIFSLLKMFDLESEFYNLQSDIDYDKFEYKLTLERQKSMLFLQKVFV